MLVSQTETETERKRERDEGEGKRKGDRDKKYTSVKVLAYHKKLLIILCNVKK